MDEWFELVIPFPSLNNQLNANPLFYLFSVAYQGGE